MIGKVISILIKFMVLSSYELIVIVVGISFFIIIDFNGGK